MTINTLNSAEPADSAFVGDGAAQIRAIKAALLEAFGGVDAAITKPEAYGTASTTTPTAADFSQLFTDIAALVNPADEAIFTKGMVMMWSGSTNSVPSGWALCEGGSDINGVAIPDLRDRFVVGQGDTYATGDTGNGGISGTADLFTGGPRTNDNNKNTLTELDLGGINDHTIGLDQLPEHNHAMFTATDGTGGDATGPTVVTADSGTPGHTERDYVIHAGSGIPAIGVTGNRGQSSTDPLTHTGTLDFDHVHEVGSSTLSGTAIPKYYALAFIIFTGEVA